MFGTKKYLWPFPSFFNESGKPVGDGVVWPTRAKETEIENVEEKNESQKEENSPSPDGFF